MKKRNLCTKRGCQGSREECDGKGMTRRDKGQLWTRQLIDPAQRMHVISLNSGVKLYG